MSQQQQQDHYGLLGRQRGLQDLQAGYFPTAENFQPTNNKTKTKGLMNSLKKYIEEHKGTLYTLGAIFLVDHFFLKGALRERITKITTNLLEKIQKTLEGV